MGLEAFNFIPDLVATNPEPTDPVAQGDDHLRGIKFTLQNQWPLIGEDQVTRTALQMNDAALRSEENIFTANQNLANNIFLAAQDAAAVNFRNIIGVTAADQCQIGSPSYSTLVRSVDGIKSEFSGTAAFPAYSFTDSPDMGFYRNGNTSIGFSVGGDTAALLLAAQFRMNLSGSVTAPAYSFQPDTGMGMYRVGADILGFATAGVSRFTIGVSNVGFTIPIRSPDGSATAPAYTFTSGSNVGMFRSAVNVIGFSTAGVIRATITNSGIRSNLAGSAGGPAYSFNDDADTGLFVVLPNNLGLSAGGVERMRIKQATVNMTLPTSNAGLSSGDCFTSSGFVAIVP